MIKRGVGLTHLSHTHSRYIFLSETLLYLAMSKKLTYDIFNGTTGIWEEKYVSEDDYLEEMRKLDMEQEVLDAELQVINVIIEQYLNDPKTWESRD